VLTPHPEEAGLRFGQGILQLAGLPVAQTPCLIEVLRTFGTLDLRLQILDLLLDLLNPLDLALLLLPLRRQRTALLLQVGQLLLQISISRRSRAAASSTRSIALSGMLRSVI